jgi:hypothetical protein
MKGERDESMPKEINDRMITASTLSLPFPAYLHLHLTIIMSAEPIHSPSGIPSTSPNPNHHHHHRPHIPIMINPGLRFPCIPATQHIVKNHGPDEPLSTRN